MRSIRFAVLGIAVAAAVAGCKPKAVSQPLPASLKECCEQAQQCRRQAREARDKYEQSPAEEAAARAGQLAAHARKLKTPSTAEAEGAVSLDVQNVAALTQEEAVLAKKLSSWSARAYRTARGAALPAACKALALAARQAKGQDLSQLDPRLADLARLAAAAVAFIRNQPVPVPVDWEAVAADLDAAAAHPPPRLDAALTVGWVLSGQVERAASEAQVIDLPAAKDDQERGALHVVRGLTWSFNHLPRLAAEEVEQGAAMMGEDATNVPQTLAMVHLVAAVICIQERDFIRADQELARAIHAWPNSPAVVFLTGERLAADGQTEPAAQSLEKLAQTCPRPDLAQRVAQRARDIRAGQATSFLGDPVLLFELVLAVAQDKSQPPAVQESARKLQAAVDLTRKVSEYLPK